VEKGGERWREVGVCEHYIWFEKRVKHINENLQWKV
jgi:hypothetical protein